MIMRFLHKGLEKFYASGKKTGIQPKHAGRLRLILARLDAVREPRDMDLPGLGLHRLSGNLKGFWSVEVSGNWRVIFKFEGDNVTDVDYLDYH
jgi:proteic killer suppression protein